MERQQTKPVPIPTSSKKKKTMEQAKNELDLAIESIRQVADTVEKAELEPMEKLEKVERFEPADYVKFGVPKPKREDVSDEQFELDTKEIFEDNAVGEEFMKKVNRFNELMAFWKAMPDYDPNVRADLPWLEENVGHYLDRRERNIQSMQQACPFHPSDPLKVLNPDAEFGPLYCKCPEEGCPVWCTTETAHILIPELIEHTHPEVRAKLTELQCKCGEVPRMKLSRTDKNKNRVFDLWAEPLPNTALRLLSVDARPLVETQATCSTHLGLMEDGENTRGRVFCPGSEAHEERMTSEDRLLLWVYTPRLWGIPQTCQEF